MRHPATAALDVSRTARVPAPPRLRAREDQGDPASRRGEVIAGRYRLERLLGEGATASVYRARHLVIGQPVAVKLLHPELVGSSEAVQRFLHEARILARLHHPNIVAIHDFDFDRADERAWLVMELLAGETLMGRCERLGRLTWSTVRRVMLRLCSALQAAHDRGIVHRDVKPENCVCLPDAADRESVKLVDFGIAAVWDGQRHRGIEPTGFVAGTPAYMAPERMSGAGDVRADVYSAAVVMYELLTGSLPFDGPTPEAVGMKHQYEPVVPPSERTEWCCSRAVDQVVLRALAKDPGDRFASMRELGNAIRRAGERAPATVALVLPTRGAAPRPRPTPRPVPRMPDRGEALPRRLRPPPVPPVGRPPSRAGIVPSIAALLALGLGVSPLGAASARANQGLWGPHVRTIQALEQPHTEGDEPTGTPSASTEP